MVVIDRGIDAESGTFGFRLEPPNPQFSVPAGLRCSLIFVSGPCDPEITMGKEIDLGGSGGQLRDETKNTRP